MTSLFRLATNTTQDVRFALRTFRKSFGFTAVALLSLALGIGVNTAIFSLIDAVLLKTLPVSHPEQLVEVAIGENGINFFANPLWEALRDRQDVFSGILASGSTEFDLASGGEAQRIIGAFVSGDYFSTLRVPTALGRILTAADDHRGCSGAAVLSYGFWVGRYGASADVLNRTISLDHHAFPIAGVTAPGFYGTTVGSKQEVFLPICAEKIVGGEFSALDRRTLWWLNVIGRLKPGVSAGQAAARLNLLAPGIFADTFPPEHMLRNFQVAPASTGLSFIRDQYRSSLSILMTVVAVVLLIACANVANLLLARATVRQKEIAVRLALGAGRARLIRQLLTESLLLSIAGAALGVVFAKWGAALIIRLLSTGRNPVFLDLALDPRVLAFTIAVAILTGLLFGLVPAWSGTHVSPLSGMKGLSSTPTRSAYGLSNALVIAQIALSLILVVSAGLLVGTFRRLETLDPGFDRSQVLLMGVDLGNVNYPKERRPAIYREMLDRLRATPGIHSVSASAMTPLGGGPTWISEVHVEGFTPVREDDSRILANETSDRYFETLGMRILAGRDFNDQDTLTSPRVAVVSESFARKFFNTSSPLGKTYREDEGPNKLGPPIQIVGIVADAKYRDLRDIAVPIAFHSLNQDNDRPDAGNFEIRTEGTAPAIIPVVKSLMAQFNPHIVLSFKTLAAQVDESLAQERLLATLSGFFGALALLLSAIGLYGVMSYRVARRRNEIGIRMALGAGELRILTMVLGDVAILLVVGLAAGIAISAAASRLIATFLYGITARDPRTVIASSFILAVVAIAAGYLPARRASRLHPLASLREE